MNMLFHTSCVTTCIMKPPYPHLSMEKTLSMKYEGYLHGRESSFEGESSASEENDSLEEESITTTLGGGL
jgi:hypothetical protein